MHSFQDMLFLFNSTSKNRFFIRMNLWEASLLYNYATKCKDDIIEIGTRYGGTSVLMASALAEDKKVYTIDISDNKEPRRALLKVCPKDIINRIKFIVQESTVAAKNWKQMAGLILIDGDHTEVGVSNDIRAWSKFLIPGGYMAFHDALTYEMPCRNWRKNPKAKIRKGDVGVWPAINKLLIGSGWKKVDHSQSLVIVQKPSL